MYFRVTQGIPPTVGAAVAAVGAARAVAVAGRARAALHPGLRRAQARLPAQGAARHPQRDPREHQGAPAPAGLHAEQQHGPPGLGLQERQAGRQRVRRGVRRYRRYRAPGGVRRVLRLQLVPGQLQPDGE